MRYRRISSAAPWRLAVACAVVAGALSCRSTPVDRDSKQGASGGEQDAPPAVGAGAPAVGAGAFRPFDRVDAQDPALLEVPFEGSRSPLVVVLQGGSYECPHTREAEVAVQAILAKHGEVARYWLHNPLPGQKLGYLLAIASSAAQRQGRFAAFHALLMQSQAAADEDHLLALARRAELDVNLFLKDMKREEIKAHVERNRALVAALGLSGTPVFLVNGRIVLGYPGQEKLESLVVEELAAARALQERGASLDALHRAAAAVYEPYRVLLTDGVRWDRVEKVDPLADPWTRFRVPVSGPPDLGSPASLVTVVLYLDLTCPHSKVAWERVRAASAAAPDAAGYHVRLNPTRRDVAALRAAAAATEARSRGNLVAFVDAYFAAQGQENALSAACAAAGTSDCTPERFDAPGMVGPLERVRVEAVAILAAGTPVYYVDGIRRSGVQAQGELDALIQRESELAATLVERGLKRESVYEFLSGRGYAVPLLAAEETPIDMAGASPMGAGEGPVRVVAMWDDASPFCGQLMPHLVGLMQRFPKQVVVYQKPYVPGQDPAAPPAVYINGFRLTVPTGIDVYSLTAAVEMVLAR